MADDSTKHIQKLVLCQRDGKRKETAPRYKMPDTIRGTFESVARVLILSWNFVFRFLCCLEIYSLLNYNATTTSSTTATTLTTPTTPASYQTMLQKKFPLILDHPCHCITLIAIPMVGLFNSTYSISSFYWQATIYAILVWDWALPLLLFRSRSNLLLMPDPPSGRALVCHPLLPSNRKMGMRNHGTLGKPRWVGACVCTCNCWCVCLYLGWG